jgi:hypothetical protein
VVDRATFLDRYGSVSAVADLEQGDRAELVARIGGIFERHSRDGSLAIPYETRTYTARAR